MNSKDVSNMTVTELVSSMSREDLGKLYTALLRIDEVNLLGDELLKALYEKVMDRYFKEA